MPHRKKSHPTEKATQMTIPRLWSVKKTVKAQLRYSESRHELELTSILKSLCVPSLILAGNETPESERCRHSQGHPVSLPALKELLSFQAPLLLGIRPLGIVPVVLRSENSDSGVTSRKPALFEPACKMCRLS